jgi:hypothetical protein
MIVTAIRIPVPLAAPIAPERSAAMESNPRMALPKAAAVGTMHAKNSHDLTAVLS